MSDRPRTRGECANGPRPCPWVSCRYHLLLEVKPPSVDEYGRSHGGTIRLPVLGSKLHPGAGPLAVDEFTEAATACLEAMAETCTLDVADSGGTILAEVGELLGVTRERARQLEEKALRSMRRAVRLFPDLVDEGSAGTPIQVAQGPRSAHLKTGT